MRRKLVVGNWKMHGTRPANAELLAALLTARPYRLDVAVCVPFVEELFWRGFLWRTMSDPYRDFADAKIGQWSAKALTVTCIAFAFAHTTPDRLAAVVWCLITSFVYVRTRSIGACVIVHAVSNLVLGLYVMGTKQWGFW